MDVAYVSDEEQEVRLGPVVVRSDTRVSGAWEQVESVNVHVPTTVHVLVRSLGFEVCQRYINSNRERSTLKHVPLAEDDEVYLTEETQHETHPGDAHENEVGATSLEDGITPPQQETDDLQQDTEEHGELHLQPIREMSSFVPQCHGIPTLSR